MCNPFMFSSFSYMPMMNMSFMPFMMSNLGFNLGFGLANLGMSLFTQPSYNYYNGGGYYQAPQSKEYELASNISDYNTKIKAELKKLGNVSEAEAKNYSIDKEPEYQQAITEAKDKKSTAQARLAEIEPKINELLTKDADERSDLEKRDLTELQVERANLKRDLAEGAKYDKEIEKAKKAKADREKEIKEAKERLAELQAERKATQGQLNYVKIDKADGCGLTQTTTKEFNKMYDLEKNCFRDGYDISKITRADMNHILSQYRNAKDATQKRQYADAFEKIYNDPNLDNRIKNKYSDMYDLICA